MTASHGHTSWHRPHAVHFAWSISSMLHNTILKYIATLKSFYNDLTITHKDDRGRLITKNVPMIYGRSEKALVAENYSEGQMLTGNTRVLPFGNITFEAFSKADDRQTNKNRLTKFGSKGDQNLYAYNSVPYDFIFNVSIRTRGAAEAYQIAEQVAPMFNPTVNLDVWDSLYEEAPTRVAVTLDGIDIEEPTYEDGSNNVHLVNISNTLRGWLYQPVFSGPKVNDTIINVKLNDAAYLSVINGEELISQSDRLKMEVIDIIKKGEILEAILDIDPKLVVKYSWNAFGGDITPSSDGRSCKLNTNDDYTIELSLTDQFGNFTSMTKTFNKSKWLV